MVFFEVFKVEKRILKEQNSFKIDKKYEMKYILESGK